MRDEDKIAFQNQVLNELTHWKRRAYRGDIALDFEVTPGQGRHAPPLIQTVVKNYLDLLHIPVKGVKTARKRLLYRDDKQVKLLSASYSHAGNKEKDEIWLRAASMGDFLEDVALAERVLRDDFTEDATTRFGERLDVQRFLDDQAKRDDDDNAFEELKKLNKDTGAMKARYGELAFQSIHWSLSQRAQDSFLGNASPDIRQWTSILAPQTRQYSVGASDDTDLARALELIDATLRSMLLSPPLALDLRQLPSLDYSKTEFKKATRAAISDYRKRYPWLFPLAVPVDVAILFVPPTGGGVDLDNLARYIVPAVNEELQPPPTPTAAMPEDLIKAYPPLAAMLAEKRKLPSYSIRRYEVVEMRRMSSEPPEGVVRLILHGGSRDKGTIQEQFQSLLSAWSKSISRL
ncbi:MAG: hypothetical protein BroJett014_03970 [Planctomycetota bacterium]|nr:hypothetical protein [Planctomycetota bacterium]GIK51424.1 MAG: hypothetical protein BroJett014_03970 [Planctomycetota bacterium]